MRSLGRASWPALTTSGGSALDITGQLNVRSLAVPTPTVVFVGATGSTFTMYSVVAWAKDGTFTAGASYANSSGNAVLNSTNYCTVNWTAVPGAVTYDIYRSAGGAATTGRIATGLSAATLTLNDTGLVGNNIPALSSTTGSAYLASGFTCSSGGLVMIPGGSGGSTYNSTGQYQMNASSIWLNNPTYAGSTLSVTGVATFAASPVFTAGINSNLGIGVTAATATTALDVNGQISIRALAAPALPTLVVAGTAGSTTYSYCVVAKQPDGSYSAASPTATTATGNATLTATNKITVSWTAVPGATSYDLYKLVGGLTGKIATTALLTIADTGLAGNTLFPSAATTGNLNVAGAITGALGGWPTWNPNSPAISASGVMTVSAVTVNEANYIRIGPIVFFKLYISLTIGGTVSTNVNITLPIAQVGVQPDNVTVNNWFGSWIAGSGTCTGTSLKIYQANQANNFSLGAQYITANGFYRCA